MKVMRRIGQMAIYAAFAAVLGYFSDSPAYTYFAPENAMIKLSFSHGGMRKDPCGNRSAQEIARLKRSQRKALECSRDRLPVVVEMELDGKVVLSETLEPGGIGKDGPSHVYRRVPVKSGAHHLVLRLRDSARASGFDYRREADIVLTPRQNFVIDFAPHRGGFHFE